MASKTPALSLPDIQSILSADNDVFKHISKFIETELKEEKPIRLHRKAGQKWHDNLYAKLQSQFTDAFGSENSSDELRPKSRAIRSLTSNLAHKLARRKKPASKTVHQRDSATHSPEKRRPMSETPVTQAETPTSHVSTSGTLPKNTTDAQTRSSLFYNPMSSHISLVPLSIPNMLLWTIRVCLQEPNWERPVSTTLIQHLISPEVLEKQQPKDLTWERSLHHIFFSKWYDFLQEDMVGQNLGNLDTFDIYASSENGPYLMQPQQRWFESAIAWQVSVQQSIGNTDSSIYFFIQHKQGWYIVRICTYGYN
jgi:hypothetical protein